MSPQRLSKVQGPKRLTTYGTLSHQEQQHGHSRNTAIPPAPSRDNLQTSPVTIDKTIRWNSDMDICNAEKPSSKQRLAKSRLNMKSDTPCLKSEHDGTQKRKHSFAFASATPSNNISSDTGISQPLVVSSVHAVEGQVNYGNDGGLLNTTDARGLASGLSPSFTHSPPDTSAKNAAVIPEQDVHINKDAGPTDVEDFALPSLVQVDTKRLGNDDTDTTKIQMRLAGTEQMANDTRLGTNDHLVVTPKSKKIKITYSQARSVRSRQHTLSSIDMPDSETSNDMASVLPPSMSSPPRRTSEYDDIDDTNEKFGIRSVHELRRAGANNRFADEMDDLLSRVGRPTRQPSMTRRNALCELAYKLQRNDFVDRFRDHAARDQVAKAIGDEEDVISGFCVVAILIVFLSSGPAPHLFQQLYNDRIGRLLALLLRCRKDIEVVADEAKLPRTSRKRLGNAKSLLARLSIWGRPSVVSLSPCTVALQLLSILHHHSDVSQYEKIMADVEYDVVKVADYYSQKGSEDDVEFRLIISVLEQHSNEAANPTGSKGVANVLDQSDTIAPFLCRTLRRWPSDQGDLEQKVLKLAINVTNAKRGAAACGDRSMLSNLASCIRLGFSRVQNDVRGGHLRCEVYDGLILILGVTINILEHFPPARGFVDVASANILAKLWSENQTLVGEANSVDESRLNVAFGYLAVVLGYLSLAEVGQLDIHGLIICIQDFLNIYKNIDQKVNELESLVLELKKQYKENL